MAISKILGRRDYPYFCPILFVSTMTFREWFSKRTSDFIWTCFTLFIVACVVWIFGSFFVSLAALLLIGIIAMAPILCLLLPIFVLYLLIRAAIDAIRKP